MACSVDTCKRPARARGFCGLHYQRWWSHGDPHTVLNRPTACVKGHPLDAENTYRHTTTSGRVERHCRRCITDRSRRRLYGLEPEEYDRMADAQADRCAICDAHCEREWRNGQPRSRSFAVDHDHATGAVRALLCERCNRDLGKVEAEPDRYEAMLCYLAVVRT